MALKVFDLEQLSRIDGGRIAVVFANHLRQVVADIEDRPADDRPRELNIKLKISPDCGMDGLLDGVKLQAQVTHKVPTHRSKVYDLGARDNQLVFNELDPQDHANPTLPFDPENADDQGSSSPDS